MSARPQKLNTFNLLGVPLYSLGVALVYTTTYHDHPTYTYTDICVYACTYYHMSDMYMHHDHVTYHQMIMYCIAIPTHEYTLMHMHVRMYSRMHYMNTGLDQ